MPDRRDALSGAFTAAEDDGTRRHIDIRSAAFL